MLRRSFVLPAELVDPGIQEIYSRLVAESRRLAVYQGWFRMAIGIAKRHGKGRVGRGSLRWGPAVNDRTRTQTAAVY